MQPERRHPRPSRPIRPSLMRAAAALTASMLLLAACGGDAGASGGTGYTFHVLIVNAAPTDVTVSYTGAVAVDDVVQPTCSAEVHLFPVEDPFVLSIDGVPVIDSDVDLPDGIPNDGQSDLIARVDVAKDGTASLVSKVRPGADIGKPSKAAYCPSLPGS